MPRGCLAKDMWRLKGGKSAGKSEGKKTKQLTHALLDSLIITRGMLTTDNYSVNPPKYLAI